MVVRMRLRPTGVRNNPLYDVVVVRNQRRPRAAPIEKLGEYQSVPSLLPNPRASTSSVLQPIPDPVYEKSLKINKDRVAYWMSAGAQPSQTVSRLLTKVKSADTVCQRHIQSVVLYRPASCPETSVENSKWKGTRSPAREHKNGQR